MKKPTIEDYEETLKNINMFIHVANNAARGAATLEDKLPMSKLLRALKSVRSTMRRNYFNFEDALDGCNSSLFTSPHTDDPD